MTPLVPPPEVRLVLTREAAKVLGCSMSQVRALAVAGTMESWSLGPTSFAYDLEELKRHKADKEASRSQGHPKRAAGVLWRSRTSNGDRSDLQSLRNLRQPKR